MTCQTSTPIFAFVYEGDRRAIYGVNGIGVSLAIMEIGKRNQLPVFPFRRLFSEEMHLEMDI